MTDLDAAKRTLLGELREHSLVIGEVTLASGAVAQYYVDARRTLMRPGGFRAAGELIAAAAHEVGAQAVGGPATAAIPPSCAALAGPAGDDLVAFFVRGEKKQHGLQRWVEGPVEAGVRCLVVEDTVTTGGSTAKAIERCREEGLEIAGVVAVVDRLAGGAAKIEAAAEAPYRALVTIDDNECAGDLQTLLADAFDRLDRRAARRHRVLDHQAARALFGRALNPALQAVLLTLAADEEAHPVLAGRGRQRRAGGRDRRRRRAADSSGADRGRGRGDQLSGGEEAGGAQQRSPRVDVVLRRRATGERHLADDQRVLAQLGEQGLLGGGEIGHAAHIL